MQRVYVVLGVIGIMLLGAILSGCATTQPTIIDTGSAQASGLAISGLTELIDNAAGRLDIIRNQAAGLDGSIKQLAVYCEQLIAEFERQQQELIDLRNTLKDKE